MADMVLRLLGRTLPL